MMKRRSIIIGGGALAASVGGAAYLTISAMGSVSEYTDYLSPLRTPLPRPADVRNLVGYVTLAPSRHNTQPWVFRATRDVTSI